MSRSCKMTKMHFELIADVITELDVSPEQRRAIAYRFSVALRYTNDHMDAQRFLQACKTEAEKAVEEDERQNGKNGRAASHDQS